MIFILNCNQVMQCEGSRLVHILIEVSLKKLGNRFARAYNGSSPARTPAADAEADILAIHHHAVFWKGLYHARVSSIGAIT